MCIRDSAYPVLSTVSSGKVLSIDTSEALTIAGVIDIYSAKDIPGKNDVSPVFTGDILLAEEIISYHSQPILLVVANSYQTARIAARKVKIEYEKSAAILDIKEAIKQESWVRPPHALHRGDAKQVIKTAKHTLDGQLDIGGQEHFYLEGQISICLLYTSDAADE